MTGKSWENYQLLFGNILVGMSNFDECELSEKLAIDAVQIRLSNSYQMEQCFLYRSRLELVCLVTVQVHNSYLVLLTMPCEKPGHSSEWMHRFWLIQHRRSCSRMIFLPPPIELMGFKSLIWYFTHCMFCSIGYSCFLTASTQELKFTQLKCLTSLVYNDPKTV